MYILISPAKTLDLDTAAPVTTHTQPQCLSQVYPLVAQLKNCSPADLKGLMSISDKLAALNHERYQHFLTRPVTSKEAKQALFCFKGDVYRAMDAQRFDKDDVAFAQQHLGMLSGLYGLLRPLDLMQAYRLEMGTTFAFNGFKNLYAYWQTPLAGLLNKALKKQKNPLLVNLASIEYSQAVNESLLDGRFLTIQFKTQRNGTYKTIGLLAKRARGMMARYIIKNRLEDAESLKAFNAEDYAFAEDLSSENNWVFVQ